MRKNEEKSFFLFGWLTYHCKSCDIIQIMFDALFSINWTPKPIILIKKSSFSSISFKDKDRKLILGKSDRICLSFYKNAYFLAKTPQHCVSLVIDKHKTQNIIQYFIIEGLRQLQVFHLFYWSLLSLAHLQPPHSNIASAPPLLPSATPMLPSIV